MIWPYPAGTMSPSATSSSRTLPVKADLSFGWVTNDPVLSALPETSYKQRTLPSLTSDPAETRHRDSLTEDEVEITTSFDCLSAIFVSLFARGTKSNQSGWGELCELLCSGRVRNISTKIRKLVYHFGNLETGKAVANFKAIVPICQWK